jgi:hypothetical protein
MSFLSKLFGNDKPAPQEIPSFHTYNNKVWWSDTEIVGADPDTLKVYSQHYAKDKDRAYHWFNVVEKADASTFEPLTYPFAKDKDQVFWSDKIVTGADPHSAEVKGGYLIDKESVYWGNKTIDADRQSFEFLGEGRAKDKDGEFYRGERTS